MQKGMRKDENTQEPQPEPKDRELQDSHRWICFAERNAEKRRKAESAMRPRRIRNVFFSAIRSRYSGDASFEDDLDYYLEKEFEDEAQQIFHFETLQSFLNVTRESRNRSSSFAAPSVGYNERAALSAERKRFNSMQLFFCDVVR